MFQKLDQQSVQIEWIGLPPLEDKKMALLIPQYNESANFDFEERLEYFKDVAQKYGHLMDVILIDDGSTNDSLSRIREYKILNPGAFHVAAVSPNANKVGALYLTTLSINHELIIISDFDTDLVGFELVGEQFDELMSDSKLMGYYFRMLPFEGHGKVFVFQQLEYSLARTLYEFHKKEKSVPVMPGAGSCYKREVLASIYNEHSGLRNGEDREATLLGLKQGYQASYLDTVTSLTRPPLSFAALVKQRVRWNLGYVETVYKERKHYATEIIKLSRIGVRTATDALIVAFTILIPIILIVALMLDFKIAISIFLLIYVGYFAWCGLVLFLLPKESVELKREKLYTMLYYPLLKIPLDWFAWVMALVSFGKKLISHKY